MDAHIGLLGVSMPWSDHFRDTFRLPRCPCWVQNELSYGVRRDTRGYPARSFVVEASGVRRAVRDRTFFAKIIQSLRTTAYFIKGVINL